MSPTHPGPANRKGAVIVDDPAPLVDSYLRDWIDSRKLPRNLADAIRYAVLGPGKRLRPILTVRSCEAVGGFSEDALVPAAAVELIHAFSLVHDDLPALDDDDLRRGRPTLHRKAGEALALLAGDALLGLAVELLVERLKLKHWLNPARNGKNPLCLQGQ